MKYREHICASCGARFLRYAINATRAAKPQYCSTSCFSAALESRARVALKGRLFSHIRFAGENDCWEWEGRRDPNGYGRLDYRRPGDPRAHPHLVHRLSYELMVGDIPSGMSVCHSCDNPPCCNPSHHFIGTQTDNNADRHAKGRTRAGHVEGSAVGTSKLTEDQVLQIIASSDSGAALGAQYGVTKDAINLIKRGVNWGWLTGIGRA